MILPEDMFFLLFSISCVFRRVVAGNVNADGTFDTADAELLQKWLLAVPDTQLADRKAADFTHDGRLNAVDLTMMKRALIE